MEYDYGPWEVIRVTWNVNKRKWCSILGPRNVNRGPCNVIMGMSNVNRGQWNVNRGPGM